MLTLMHKFSVLSLIIVGLIMPVAFSADWPQWRGPTFNGISTAKNMPGDISSPDSILWSLDLPGDSSATPIVVGNRVFLVSNGPEAHKLYAICADLDSGKEHWRKQLDEAPDPLPRNTMSSCSPVADQERVYFLFGTGLLTALDFDGNEVWSRSIGDQSEIAQQFGYSSSPLLLDGCLYLQILRSQWRSDTPFDQYSDKDSFLLCLVATTGETVYKEHRKSDAQGESHDSYTTPMPYIQDGKTAIVLQGGDCTTGHDAATGKELWRFTDNPKKQTHWRLIPTPVIMDELIFNSQPRGGLAYAFNPNDTTQNNVDSAEWVYNERATDVPTPAYYKGKLYMLNGVQKTLTCFEPKTGEVLWIGELPDNRRFWSSPAIADDKIYMVDEMGDVVVVSTDKFEILSSTKLGGRTCKSSPALVDGKVLIRTAKKLICLGQ